MRSLHVSKNPSPWHWLQGDSALPVKDVELSRKSSSCPSWEMIEQNQGETGRGDPQHGATNTVLFLQPHCSHWHGSPKMFSWGQRWNHTALNSYNTLCEASSETAINQFFKTKGNEDQFFLKTHGKSESCLVCTVKRNNSRTQTETQSPLFGCLYKCAVMFWFGEVHQDRSLHCTTPTKAALLFLVRKIYFSSWLIGWVHASNSSSSVETLPDTASWCALKKATFHSGIISFSCTSVLLHGAPILLFLLRQDSSDASNTPIRAGLLHTWDILFLHYQKTQGGNRFLFPTYSIAFKSPRYN